MKPYLICFGKKLDKDQGYFEVDLPVLPRKIRCLAQLDDGNAVGDHPAVPQVLYRQYYYYKALDFTINCIKS